MAVADEFKVVGHDPRSGYSVRFTLAELFEKAKLDHEIYNYDFRILSEIENEAVKWR